MRLYYLFIPLFLSCKTISIFHTTKATPYDSLKKYSYLLVGLPRNDSFHSGSIDISTGFFVRAHNRLFLVSAYHALTGCDVLIGKFHDIRDDSLQVWYTDTSGTYRFEQFPLTAYKNKPCHTLIPDVDTMDVTGYFNDGRIRSIEQMMSHNLPQNRIAVGDSVICFGYPQKNAPSKTWEKSINPLETTSCVASDATVPKPLSAIDFVIRPGLKSGYSGGPLFKIKAKEPIEFVGVQSSTECGNAQSLVVRSFELGNLIQWK